MQKLKEIDKLHSNYMALLTATKNNNMLKAESSMEAILSLENGFWDSVQEYILKSKQEIAEVKSLYNSNQDYASSLLEILLAKGIPAEQKEAGLFVGPLEVMVNVEEFYIVIAMGRKKMRITDLEINKVARVVEQYFKKLNSSFNANAFFKKLLKAYGFANTRLYSNREVQYGYGVELKEIFELFTLSPTSSDYKIENFLWDIGRLCTTTNQIDIYQIELGCSRDVKKMYQIKTGNGDTLKASTLTIHKETSNDNDKQ